MALRASPPPKPAPLRLDNGSELTSIERFGKTYCTEVLDAYLFGSVAEVRQTTDAFGYS